jgi:hypothetical protein
MPLYPSKVLQVKERALTFYFSVVFCLGLTFESLKEWECVSTLDEVQLSNSAQMGLDQCWVGTWVLLTPS